MRVTRRQRPARMGRYGSVAAASVWVSRGPGTLPTIMPQPAPSTRPALAPRPRARAHAHALGRTLALPPSLRRRGRARRRGAPAHAALRTALRVLLALPEESARDADHAVALIMRRVRAAD